MIAYSGSLPWFLPLSVLALLFSLPASGPAGRWLGVPRLVAWVLVVNLGVILAGTLSPLADPSLSRGCDVSRVGLAPLDQLRRPSDVLGNILAFIPLGVTIALIPRSRRKLAVLLGAIALPFVIEAIQLSVVPLGRACQVADVVDNLTGLAIGLVAGVVVAWLAGRRRATAS